MTDSTDGVHPDDAPSHPTSAATGQPVHTPASSVGEGPGVEYLDSRDGVVADHASDTSGQPSGGSARPGRRRALVAAAVLAVGLVGGGVAYGVGQLSGGGTQPDERVPASALAIVSLDLDPSAGQKVDALRFARKFPKVKARIGSGDDLRKMLFDAVSDSSDVTASWKDVEPWLGDRAAVAVLPAADELDEPVPVVVLAVKDEDKARVGLRTAMPTASCEISDGFAVCAKEAAAAKQAVADAARKSLSDDSTYAGDMKTLGDHGILAAWADLSRVKKAAPDLLSGMGAMGSSLAGATGDLKGRYVAAVRFDGPHLELAGRVEGAGLPKLSGSADVGDLPKDTLLALGVGNADTVVSSAWQRLRTAASGMGAAETFDAQVSTLSSTYGISLPDDLVSAVGDQLTLAVGPGAGPQVAVRMTGSKDSIDRLLSGVKQASGSMLDVATATSGHATVLATDARYATAVAQGKGLADTDRFRDAVADADGAQGVLYVDLAGLVSAYGDQLALDAGGTEELKPLSALGVTVHQDGAALDYRVRLATR